MKHWKEIIIAVALVWLAWEQIRSRSKVVAKKVVYDESIVYPSNLGFNPTVIRGLRMTP